MKKLLVVLSILTIAVTGSALAQDLIWQNNIGAYLADGSYEADAAQGDVLELHMILTNMTSPACGGFEYKLSTVGGLFIMESTVAYPTDSINAASREGEFIVGYGNPIPAVDGAVEVMSVSVIVTDEEEPSGLYIGAVYFASIPGVPCYLADAANAIIVEMHQSLGDSEAAVFEVNEKGQSPIATESTSFDNLKSLYR